jgi:hypothetical protein
LVVPRLKSTPFFDERFTGYGKNKIQWIQHLRLTGFEFYVLPRAFVMHCPHPLSAARVYWPELKDNKDRLFQDFIEAKMRNATIRTSLCVSEDGEHERAKAWVNWRPPKTHPRRLAM